ncbi:hypothetical protein C1645_828602 [Glomus cerebriforme]|uniref:Uncharacterized protein n=1 Tax=Glomus cerebriforme TaxID=658196 RepID=A0A397SLG0_9GLOM|nr:hypothetical protein C1645_828602 [Glomus cerebriforme]
MRILSKSARETKEQFFGKHGWTLHTILVFTKCDTSDQLNVQAFDHWSTDTKQDAWFTILSFDSVFETLNPRPRWIEIYQWYNIEIYGWYFLKPGEAKTSIDSHHIQVAHAIKRYVRIGHNLDEEEKIQIAIADLGRISVVNLEPIHNNHNVKTIAGITKLFYFEWPTDGDYTRYIRVQCLPHIGLWSQYSPFEISKLTTMPINKLTPNITSHSVPKNPWNFSLFRVQGTNKQKNDNQTCSLLAIEEAFELKREWALKSNQIYGKRGAGKRMTKIVKAYLESYFLAGNMNRTDRMTAKNMVEQLQILVDEGEIQADDIPKIITVASWITQYAASLKKQTAVEKVAKVAEGSSNARNANNFQKMAKSSSEKSRSCENPVCDNSSSEQIEDYYVSKANDKLKYVNSKYSKDELKVMVDESLNNLKKDFKNSESERILVEPDEISNHIVSVLILEEIFDIDEVPFIRNLKDSNDEEDDDDIDDNDDNNNNNVPKEELVEDYDVLEFASRFLD